MSKMHRSAKSGQFVSKGYAKSHPSTTVSETRGGGATGAARSAKTGRFVSDSYARRHPSTTVKES